MLESLIVVAIVGGSAWYLWSVLTAKGSCDCDKEGSCSAKKGEPPVMQIDLTSAPRK